MAGQEGKYGAVQTEKKQLHPGEPVFLLRATDPLSPAVVELYAVICRRAGCSLDHCQAVERRAEEIRQWQRANPLLVKEIPD